MDLSVEYLGLKLRNPIVCSSSPLCGHVESALRLEAAGAAAIILPSLFEEQIEIDSQDLDRFLDHGVESYAEATSYLPDMADYNQGVDGYFDMLRECKRRLKIPVIASLNGCTRGGWINYAAKMQAAGADALELNLYFLPVDPEHDASTVETEQANLVTAVRAEISIPLAVKLSPCITAPVAFGRRLAAAGASGLVLFNRFYQPDFDLEKLEVFPMLRLSSPQELLSRLHWVALMHDRVEADLAITGGVHSGLDALKAIMAGANVAMTTSSLLRAGPDHLRLMLAEMSQWLTDHEYESARQAQGSMSMRRIANPERYQRLNYLKVLRSYALRD